MGNKKFDLAVDATSYPHSLARGAGLNYANQMPATAMQEYCKGELDPDAVTLNFSDRGYAWLIPRGNLINFGVGGLYTKRALERAFEENIKHFGLKPAAGAPRTSVGLVGGPVRRLTKGKLVVAGEAAGAVMSMTGEGIRFALWSGSICFKRDYGRLFWRGYGERLRFGGKLLKLILRLSDEERLELLWRGTPKLHGGPLRRSQTPRQGRGRNALATALLGEVVGASSQNFRQSILTRTIQSDQHITLERV